MPAFARGSGRPSALTVVFSDKRARPPRGSRPRFRPPPRGLRGMVVAVAVVVNVTMSCRPAPRLHSFDSTRRTAFPTSPCAPHVNPPPTYAPHVNPPSTYAPHNIPYSAHAPAPLCTSCTQHASTLSHLIPSRLHHAPSLRSVAPYCRPTSLRQAQLFPTCPPASPRRSRRSPDHRRFAGARVLNPGACHGLSHDHCESRDLRRRPPVKSHPTVNFPPDTVPPDQSPTDAFPTGVFPTETSPTETSPTGASPTGQSPPDTCPPVYRPVNPSIVGV